MIPEDVAPELRMLIEEEVLRRLAPLRLRLKELETQVRELRAQVEAQRCRHCGGDLSP